MDGRPTASNEGKTMTIIAERDLDTTMIAGTEISIAQLIDVFIRTQDGRLDREMEAEHGLELGERVTNARSALRDVHRSF
jgi:hypothetical protein